MAVNTTDLWLMTEGAAISLALALVSVSVGTLLAMVLACLAFLPFAPARWLYRIYIFVVRGTPVLVLALCVFYGLGTIWPRMNAYVAGVIVLIVYLSALFAEVFRGGVIAIQRPIWDSATSLGLPRRFVFLRIVAPLAARYSLPPYLNVCVMAVKASSVLSIIGVWELTFASREIIERTLDVFRVLFFAAALYFLMCFAVDRAGKYFERRLMARGFAGEHR